MKLINKDAVVAEIERIKEIYCYDTKTNASFVAEAVINSINNAINTLEVKELENSNDAFVDKAVSYLNSKLYDWVQTTNPNQRSYANTIMKQDFIEDFRKYMEGE